MLTLQSTEHALAGAASDPERAARAAELIERRGAMQRPLTGVRVLDLSQFLAGPYGSMILGDLGAEVLKIEIPGKGDGSREMPPHFVHGQSGYFLSMNRSKKSMTLDLKSPAGLEIFYELVRRSDVVYDNFRPGILERLRIDYETLKQINPR